MRAAVLVLVLATVSAASAQEVRVRLFEGRAGSTATLTSPEAAVRVEVDGAWVAEAAPGERVRVERSGGRVRVEVGGERTSGERATLASEEPIRLRTGRYDRRYRGRLELSARGGRLRVINAVPMQPYVASVVASEYPFREIEGAKAQAVLARTYALRHQGSKNGYDVEDSQRSQVYKGAGQATETTRQAARETAGQVLMHGTEVVDAVYSSSNGGHSASNEHVWHTDPVPYLRGRPDPYDRDAPDHRWNATVSASGVHAALSRYARGTTAVRVTRRAPSGHATEITLSPSGRRITGGQFRAAVNASLGWRTVKSTNLEISRSGSRYRLSGRGFGHGVGMSQYGARGQARAGHSYTEILAFYFEGTHLVGAIGEAMPHSPLAARPDGLRRMPTRRAVAWGLEPDTSRVQPVPPSVAAPRPTPEADYRPVRVVRDPLPNGDRVRSRPTRRADARAEAARDSTSRRRGW